MSLFPLSDIIILPLVFMVVVGAGLSCHVTLGNITEN